MTPLVVTTTSHRMGGQVSERQESWGPHESAPPASRFVNLPARFAMRRGETLCDGRVAYETVGRLDSDNGNVVLLLPGLSVDAHVTPHTADPGPGWWGNMVGPGKPIDTNHWFVICVNSLGSCKGSTGPASLMSDTGRPYGLTFPALTLEDVADAAVHTVRSLGIDSVACVVGTSMGGMSALALLERHPGLARAHVNISAGLHSPPFATAMRSLQRELVRGDPEWRNGDYTGHTFPTVGMRTARKLGLITYRSAEEWDSRFGRRRLPHSPEAFEQEFEVEAYLHATAEQFVDHFDPNCFLYLSRAIDWFEAGQRNRGNWRLESALVLGVRSDHLFPFELQAGVEVYLEGRTDNVELMALDSDKGHDAFLVDTHVFGPPISRFLNRL